MRLLLINPNTNRATTDAMLAIARAAAPDGVGIEGATAGYGVKLITTPDELSIAAQAVLDVTRPDDLDGVIIAAFGDPGLRSLRQAIVAPVTGIAEAAMAEAARQGRFAVVTTTPGLVASITGLANEYGHSQSFAGVWLTAGEAAPLMADPPRLLAALAGACSDAVRDGAAAIVIGGGPLAAAARELRAIVTVPVIEPVPAAIRLAIARIPATGMPHAVQAPFKPWPG